MELINKVQNYDWGKKGGTSTVAILLANVDVNFKINEELPYAELWMGTHVNGPSQLKTTGKLLSEELSEHSEYLGEGVLQNFGPQLPYLFKVLSVNKALSIQAHPSKKHAEDLHKKFPNIYKDPNHKPEMAIAITPFEALCGFRPFQEITTYLQTIPELKKIIGPDISEQTGENLIKNAFRAVLTCHKDHIASELENMLQRFKTLDKNERNVQLADLVERLYSQFPNDVGIFMVYFLNYLQLKPSEAIFLGANEPHAYLFGDCIECMACSDNVVRAGLTPKFIDVETLCSMLIYKGEKPEDKLFRPIEENVYCKIYKPPVSDFALIELQIPKSLETFDLPIRNTGSIVLVLKGKGISDGIDLKKGTSIFIPANSVLNIKNITEDFLIYQAIANV